MSLLVGAVWSRAAPDEQHGNDHYKVAEHAVAAES